jgi:hypothetical protein
MKSNSNNHFGNALIIACIALLITMGMHPSGGSMEHIRNTIPMIMASHSIALFAIPVLLAGFWGLTKLLNQGSGISRFGFFFMAFGLVAGMCAAALNGLALPLILTKFSFSTGDELNLIKIILSYNSSLNQAFDFIFIGGAVCSTAAWSYSIISTGLLPKWTGYLGIALSLLALMPVFPNMAIVHLTGFRFFIIGFSIWTVIIGVLMKRVPEAVV